MKWLVAATLGVASTLLVARPANAACVTNTDCNPTPMTPICDAMSHTCRACTAMSDCVGNVTSPFCATMGAKAGQCVACTATAGCQAPTPVCDVGSGLCVACVGSSDCNGATPVCNVTAHQCVACMSDFQAQNPPLFSCSNPQLPACQKSGPLNGQCTQCSATNRSECTGDTPACVVAKGTCGCNDDSECDAGKICDAPRGAAGQCVVGCRVVGGHDTCGPNQFCDKRDGSVGMCVTQSCQRDADCGGPMSGVVCDDTTKVCHDGCRGTGGNGCPSGATCTSHDMTIGHCVGSDAGARDGGGSDGGGNGDGGAGDGGGTGNGDGGLGGGDGGGNGDVFDGSIIEGGGCACRAAEGTTSTSRGGLAAIALAAMLFTRRRRSR